MVMINCTKQFKRRSGGERETPAHGTCAMVLSTLTENSGKPHSARLVFRRRSVHVSINHFNSVFFSTSPIPSLPRFLLIAFSWFALPI